MISVQSGFFSFLVNLRKHRFRFPFITFRRGNYFVPNFPPVGRTIPLEICRDERIAAGGSSLFPFQPVRTERCYPLVQHFQFQLNLRWYTHVIYIAQGLHELVDQSNCRSSAD